ncbi:MAG TPA: two-component system response regulator [Blastocatellia bacterium]|jgi:response regulator RpfG family c-di-GMP phosphodiesterase|nr:two-component system response regulator [Blastocatellia bacterium]HAF24015.1 two-component system response regulator [Blastocatellia bacterium]HCX31397.1 two-component system response regulator [Blastocatellia bacterium]
MSGGYRSQILIVDDEPEITAILSDLFSGEHDCTTAGMAEEALQQLAKSDYELVVSDITMPGMSGLDMIPHVKSISPNSVVVMISGMQTVESAIDALRLGAFDYVMKPFDLRQVEAVVKRALEHQDLIVAKQRYEDHLEELVEQRTAELDRALNSLEDAYRSTLKALTAALETRDLETHGHSERVVSYSLRLGREYGLDSRRIKELEFGSLLHDIGKIGVPDSILRKPAKLTDEEWVRMREHPLHGQQILRGIEFLRGAALVVAQHHEKWDGSGYPLGLRGEEIDLCARIFSVADAFDAMTSNRVYRKGKPYQNAARELDDWAGRQFDPKVVEAFHRVPQSDWEELHERSLMKKEDELEVRCMVEMLESQLEVVAN